MGAGEGGCVEIFPRQWWVSICFLHRAPHSVLSAFRCGAGRTILTLGSRSLKGPKPAEPGTGGVGI